MSLIELERKKKEREKDKEKKERKEGTNEGRPAGWLDRQVQTLCSLLQ